MTRPGVGLSGELPGEYLFCVRLDKGVDGTANTVVEIDSAPRPARPGQPAWQRVEGAR